MSTEPQRPIRFLESMPKPLMAVFVVLGLGAIGVSLAVLFFTPGDTVALQDRRPPPASTFSHDVGRIGPAPIGSVVPTLPPACDAVRTTKLVASGDGVTRLRAILEDVCRLAGGGAGDRVTAAARSMGGVTLRFGGFDRTGVESTADFATKTIWLNIKFALRSRAVEELAPLVLHDAFHLASPSMNGLGGAMTRAT